MSGQSALRERAALLEELRQIVQAMKNIAIAELQRVTHLVPANELATDAVLQALRSLAQESEPPSAPLRAGAPVGWLVIGAERGFCGAFNDRLVQEAQALGREGKKLRLLIAGTRLGELLGAEARGAVVLPGCAAIEDAETVLDAWLAALAQEAARCGEFWLLHTGEGAMIRRRLLPMPANSLPETHAKTSDAPLHYLPVPALRLALVQQALRLALQGGLFVSLKQEHRWRLAQMQRAQDHLDELGQTLRRRRAALRQTEITNEQETLMSSLSGVNLQHPQSPLAMPGL